MNQPVFPSQYLLPENQGMSLRDYFAAKAMQSMYEEMIIHLNESEHNLANAAYRLADEMMRARNS